MDFSTFFVFGSTFSRLPVCVSNDGLNWETNCRIVKGDYTDITLPVIFKQSSGKKWTDILNPNSVSMYVVSQRFIELLDKNNISGWKSYPVRIFDKEEKEISGYMGFSIVGRSGTVDYSKAEVYEKQLVPNGPKTKYYKGLYFDLNTWDESDFFIPQDTLQIIITEKVAKKIENYKITNISLQNLTSYEISEYALPKDTSV